jgi:hypothetical protein
MNTALYSSIMQSLNDQLNTMNLESTTNVLASQSTLDSPTSDNTVSSAHHYFVVMRSLYDQLNTFRLHPTTASDATTIDQSTSDTVPISDNRTITSSDLTAIIQTFHHDLDSMLMADTTDDGMDPNGQFTSHAGPANGGMLDIETMGLHTSRNDITAASQSRALNAQRLARISKLKMEMDQVAKQMGNLSVVKATPMAVPTLRDIEKVRKSETLSDEEKDAQIGVLRKAIQAARRAYQVKCDREFAAFVGRLGNNSGRSNAEVKRLYKESGLKLKSKSCGTKRM